MTLQAIPAKTPDGPCPFCHDALPIDTNRDGRTWFCCDRQREDFENKQDAKREALAIERNKEERLG